MIIDRRPSRASLDLRKERIERLTSNLASIGADDIVVDGEVDRLIVEALEQRKFDDLKKHGFDVEDCWVEDLAAEIVNRSSLIEIETLRFSLQDHEMSRQRSAPISSALQTMFHGVDKGNLVCLVDDSEYPSASPQTAAVDRVIDEWRNFLLGPTNALGGELVVARVSKKIHHVDSIIAKLRTTDHGTVECDADGDFVFRPTRAFLDILEIAAPSRVDMLASGIKLLEKGSPTPCIREVSSYSDPVNRRICHVYICESRHADLLYSVVAILSALGVVTPNRCHIIVYDPERISSERLAWLVSRLFSYEFVHISENLRGSSLSKNRSNEIARHVFSRTIRRETRKLHELDNWHGVAAVLSDYLVIGLVIGLSVLMSGYWGLAFYLVVALPLIGCRQRALATLLHESAHGTLAKNGGLNQILGTLFSGFLILQTRSAYMRSHIRDHHGHFGDPTRDPDLRTHINAGLYDVRSGRAFVTQYLIAPLFGLNTLKIGKELILARLLSSRSDLREIMAMTVLWIIGSALVSQLAGIEFLLLYWVAPLLVTFPLVNWYLELLEHYPLIGSASLDVHSTRHRALGPLTRHLFGIHGEGYHLDHHLSPRVPFWNLKALHAARMKDATYAQWVWEISSQRRFGGLLWQFLDMKRRVDRMVSARAGEVPTPGPIS